MAGVCLKAVSKVYDNGQHAVRAADFTVADGELLVLVGPSGCGKSTLLRMIAGIESISEGEIRIGERRVNELSPKDRDIAMVFQSYALYPHMTVAGNLGFGLRLRGLPAAEVTRSVRAAADMLGLGAMLDKRPRQLSGGQRQRVALGRALVRQPQVFLLDEPLSNLDAALRQSMRVEIARLHRRLAATMIYVTHDQVEAMTLGDRIVVMRDGIVQQIDTPQRVYGQPANLFVATFIGSPRMNLLAGVLAAGGAPRVVGADGAFDLRGLDRDAAGLASYVGREIVIGIRPEHLRLAADEAQARLHAELELVESIGSDVYLNLRHGNTALVARVPPDRLPAPGARVALDCACADLRFFDARSERLITPA